MKCIVRFLVWFLVSFAISWLAFTVFGFLVGLILIFVGAFVAGWFIETLREV